MNICELIKKVRIAHRMNQREFAALMEMTPSAICHWENGVRIPHMKNLRRLMQLSKNKKIKFDIEDLLHE